MDENNSLAVPAIRRDLNDSSPLQIRDRIRGLIRVRARHLVPNKKNWRRHPRAQADALRGLLGEIGHADVIIARQLSNGKYEIIDGHLRAEITPDAMVPVIVLDVTEEEAYKLLLTLDPSAAMAESDPERMIELLKTVRTDNAAVLELLRRTAGNRVWEIVHPEHLDEVDVSPDLADELMKKWCTQLDQLWKIGPHHVVSGDCTDETVVRRLFESATPARFRMLACDPPYGVSYSAKNDFLNALDRGNRVQKPIANDQDPNLAPQIFSDGLRVAIRYAEKGASCYATVPGGPLLPDFIEAFNKSGFSFKSLLVWVKNQFVLGRSDYQLKHENILYGWIESGSHYFVNDRTQCSVFEIDKPHSSELHPTSKPIALMAPMIANSSRPGELVYDPFAGSGTSIVAAHQLGRVGYGCKIDPCYLAVILERLSVLGLKPELIQ
jgi:DNA modification methylase